MDKLLLKSIKYILQHILNQYVMFKISAFTCLIFLFFGCTASKFKQAQPKFDEGVYENQFTGLLIIDPKTKDTIVAKNAAKYFIPASTTKLFTFYTANKILNAKLPSLKYAERKDTIYIQGTGDPSWLHPHLKDTTAIDFLRKTKKNIILDLNNFKDKKYRPGWAWEDYQYYFSPELGPIPFYGNVVTIHETDSLKVLPNNFINAINRGKENELRKFDKNKFVIPNSLNDTLEIPFITSHKLTKTFIEQKLNKKVLLAKSLPHTPKKVLYGIATDSIYKRMLHNSDNFIAEQLMLVISSTLSDTLSFNTAKNYILENDLSDIKQHPRWVDGSGLSRYNLFTPESMVAVLQKMYDEIDNKRLFALLPAWNGNGTVLKPKAIDNHFIYAKSGSMGNIYNLCGYLKTKSGKIFIFSFMNNHFRTSAKEIRFNMDKTLTLIHNSY